MSAWSISSAEPLLPGGGGCARYLRHENPGETKTKKEGCLVGCWLLGNLEGEEGGKTHALGETKPKQRIGTARCQKRYIIEKQGLGKKGGYETR